MENIEEDLSQSYRRALSYMEDAVSNSLLFHQLEQTNPVLATVTEAIVKEQWDPMESMYRKHYPDRNHFLRIISTDLQLVHFGFTDIAQRQRYTMNIKNSDMDLPSDTDFNDYYFLCLCEDGVQMIISPGSSPLRKGGAVAYKTLQDADGNRLTPADTLQDFIIDSNATIVPHLAIGVPVSLSTNRKNITTSPLLEIHARYAPNSSSLRITNTINETVYILEQTMHAAYTVASGIPVNNTTPFGRQTVIPL